MLLLPSLTPVFCVFADPCADVLTFSYLSRGLQMDGGILVVSATDGPMPQTSSPTKRLVSVDFPPFSLPTIDTFTLLYMVIGICAYWRRLSSFIPMNLGGWSRFKLSWISHFFKVERVNKD